MKKSKRYRDGTHCDLVVVRASYEKNIIFYVRGKLLETKSIILTLLGLEMTYVMN
jgi:hypothetical protein